jgi:hypothetical protein
VQVGDTVTWQWSGLDAVYEVAAADSATAKAGGYSSGDPALGGAFPVRFTFPGTHYLRSASKGYVTTVTVGGVGNGAAAASSDATSGVVQSRFRLAHLLPTVSLHRWLPSVASSRTEQLLTRKHLLYYHPRKRLAATVKLTTPHLHWLCKTAKRAAIRSCSSPVLQLWCCGDIAFPLPFLDNWPKYCTCLFCHRLR